MGWSEAYHNHRCTLTASKRPCEQPIFSAEYIERAVNALRESGYEVDDDHLQYL